MKTQTLKISRICTKCSQEKDLQEFYLAGCGFRRRGDCKSCILVAKKVAYFDNHSDELEKRRAAYLRKKASGYKEPRLRNIWKNMIQRCTNPSNPSYAYYGGRGIEVSKEWETYQNFAKEMGPTHKDHLSLDRIDNSKGYSKENCRWATQAEQARNKRDNLIIEYAGERMCLVDWASRLGLAYDFLYARIATYGWSVEEAFTLPALNKSEISKRKALYRANREPLTPKI